MVVNLDCKVLIQSRLTDFRIVFQCILIIRAHQGG